VHVNRVPVAGRVTSVTHRPGRFLAAYRPEAADVNERTDLVLETLRGPVSVAQIAGLIARRIVVRVAPGDRLAAGARYGLIRFGSCTQLTLPPGAEPLVKIGDAVRGGTSAIARWRDRATGAP
jgi:phosphatidylserine decarboxylase